MSTERKIFISHRFADKQIADVVRRHLGIWGFDTMIFQASAPGLGPRAGEYITEEIKESLSQAKLLILIYTLMDHDWSFCMWECGLATSPKDGNTRTIVFQCNPFDTPKTFEGQLLVKTDKDGIKNFTTQFHREENFFPGEAAVRPDITEQTVGDLSTNFYNDLCAVIPPGRREDRYRWDFLTLQLTPADVHEIKDNGDENIIINKIQNKCLVVKDFGEALKHFGYSNLESDLKLAGLIERWRLRAQNRQNISDDWIKELGVEIYRAIDNSPASPEWKILNSINYPGSWFHPVVNHVRILPDGSMEFDVYLYRSIKQNSS